MLNRISKHLVILAGLSLSTIALADDNHQGKFAFSEHVSAGDAVKLAFKPKDEAKPNQELMLPTGVKLSYGEIVSLGDFYGLKDDAIAFGRSPNERKTRFVSVFHQFASDTNNREELKKIIETVRYEGKLIADAMKNGKNIPLTYQENSNEIGRQINCTTGGGCSESSWWLYPGRALMLANTNFDHFRPYAMKAYLAGHQAAMEQALIAHATNKKEDLELAYAMNAFASHFLSDRFSAGHIRTPRKMLYDRTTPATTGSLIAHYMHDEENEAGIHVHNQQGKQWTAYGDRYYFEKNNQSNRDLLHQALQQSADEIFYVYVTGQLTADGVGGLVPEADETTENEFANDISPMFYWRKRDNSLERRADLSNTFDRHYTDSWWGWSTLAELKRLKGIKAH